MLGSTLGAWETLVIRATLDISRFVPISTKRAREKVEKGSQLPNAQLISLLGQCLLGGLQPCGKGTLQRKRETKGRRWELSQCWEDGALLGKTFGNECRDLESQVVTVRTVLV